MNFYYEILPIIISLLGITLLILVRKKVSNQSYLFSFWVAGLVFFSTYLFMIIATSGLDAYYKAEYDSYDLDKNGFIESFERTEGFLEAQKKITNDTARNLIHITGVFISLLISTTVLIVGLIGTYIKLKTTHNNV